jgi:hypothetical protein
MSTVLQIAPQLPPAVDGVGDYCWHLWRHWPESTEGWAFAAMGGLEATRRHWPEARLHAFQPNARSLDDAIERRGAQSVVLHYVGYGYNPKGVPLWLAAALTEWRTRSFGRLVTMFHEMYAESTPLRSPFWVKPWARRVIQQLVQASDAWITSCERYSDQLINEFGARPELGARIPIAANIPVAPELEEHRLWPLEFGRKLRVAIFGLPNTRLTALRRHGRLLKAMISAELVESILLIGKSDRSARHAQRVAEHQRQIGGQWRLLFDLPPIQVAEALAECDVGLIANEPDTLTKSGVFAALATNGVVAVVADSPHVPVPPPFNDCVLLNDEDAEGGAILAELRGVNGMTARRRATLRAARAELSWDRVALAFRQAVDAAQAPNRSIRPQSAAVVPPATLDRNGVRA